MFELVDSAPQSAVIKVIGVGGGGGNAVRHMIDHQVDGVDFICANTDAQALSDISSKTVLQLGSGITKGWVQAPTQMWVALRLWKIRTVLLMRCMAPIWCSLPREWAVAPARVLPRLWQRWRESSAS
jgi:hypothetical protein